MFNNRQQEEGKADPKFICPEPTKTWINRRSCDQQVL